MASLKRCRQIAKRGRERESLYQQGKGCVMDQQEATERAQDAADRTGYQYAVVRRNKADFWFLTATSADMNGICPWLTVEPEYASK